MIVPAEARAGDHRAASMPVRPDALPFLMRCPDGGARFIARLDRPDAP